MFMCNCFRTIFLSDLIPSHQEEKRCADTAYVNSTPERICKNRFRYRICASWSAYQFANDFTKLSWFVSAGAGQFWLIIWPESQFIKARCSLRLQLKRLCVTVFVHFSSFCCSSGLQDASGIHFALTSLCPAKANSIYKVNFCVYCPCASSDRFLPFRVGALEASPPKHK